MKKILLLITIILTGCSAPKHVTQLVEHVQKDTVYLSNILYDSIYIYNDRVSEYHLNPANLSPPSNSDTLYIKERAIEFRYKLLRNTVRFVQRDSIPYEVTVIETKEIQRPLTIFDRLCRLCFSICLFGLLILLYKFLKYFRSGGILNH